MVTPSIQRSCVYKSALLGLSHILLPVKAEIWGRVFYSGWSMNVHFLSGAVVLGVERSASVGRGTMLTRLPCSLTESPTSNGEPKSVDSASPASPHARRIARMAVRGELCESERGCQERSFVSVTKITWILFKSKRCSLNSLNPAPPFVFCWELCRK